MPGKRPFEIIDTVRRKISNGVLPNNGSQKVWAALGSGRTCDGCDEPISREQVEHEVELLGHRTLRFHQPCLEAWRVLAGREIGGGSAPSAWTVIFDLGVARDANVDVAALNELLAASAESHADAVKVRLLARIARGRAAASISRSQDLRRALTAPAV